MSEISCMVVDDHPLYRRALLDGLRATENIRVLGEAGDVKTALSSRIAGPDVLLLDLGLPGLAGRSAVEAIRQAWPKTQVLVVTASESRSDLVDTLAAGASGYMTKHAAMEELADAVTRVSAGEVYVTPRLASYLLEDDRLHGRGDDSLSPREREVLQLVAEGERDKDIAARLFISLKTVQSHLTRIRDKTGRRRRAELTRLAIDSGLVEPRE